MSFNKFRTKNFFKNINIQEFKTRNNSFHEVLDKHFDEMTQLYNKNENFKDIMPYIYDNKRMQLLYKKLVYKGIKFQSHFMKGLGNILKKEEIKKDNIKLKKNQFNELYKQSAYDLAKLRKKRLDKFKNLLELDIKRDYQNLNNNLRRSSSNFNENMVPKTSNINQNFSLNDSNYSLNNSNNNFSLSNKFTKYTNKSFNSIEKSTYYKSSTNFGKISLNSLNFISPIIKKSKVKYIMNKCNEEIHSGIEFNENMNKINETFSKTIKTNYKPIRLFNEYDKLNLDNITLKKYRNMETNNLNETKRKMDEKISIFYAFNNRKGFNELIKKSSSSNSYYMYLHDIQKENKYLGQIRKEERKKIHDVELLCEDDFNKQELLKKQIDMYNKKHRKEKRIKNILMKKEFLMTQKKNNENDEELKGNFISKIMSLKEKCNKEITVGNFILKKRQEIKDI